MRSHGLALCAVLLSSACSTPTGSSPDAEEPTPMKDADAVALPPDAEVAEPDGGTIEAHEDADTPVDATNADDAGMDPIDAGEMTPVDGGTTSMLGPYALDGAESFTTLTIEVANAGHTFEEHLHLPDSAGPHAVVLFAPGTQQPASSYEIFFRRLASHGIIVMARNDPGPFTNTQVLVDELVYVGTTWLPAQNADANSPLFGRVDLAHLGVAGHSRGGKATLLAAEGGLMGSVLAYFGVDMIDATFIDDGVYAQTDVANVGIPTVFLVASEPGGCSPASSNGDVLYGLASSPSVKLTAIGADHTDFAMPCIGCMLACGAPTGTADPATVRDYSARYLMAFFARELLGDASVGATFEGAGSLLDESAGLIDVVSK